MNKKIIPTLILALSLALGSLLGAPVYAEDNDAPIDEPVDEFDATETVVTTSDSISVGETTDVTNIDETDDTIAIDETETELEEGTSDEAEVVCADTDEPGCEDPEDETDPELWPLIISLVALGATVVFVVILNLIGHRKK